MADLFIELFPVDAAALPALTVYGLVFSTAAEGSMAAVMADRLAQRLGRTFPGLWFSADASILTDNPRSPVELMITVDLIRAEQPDFYAALQAVEEAAGWQPSGEFLADFVVRTRLDELNTLMLSALTRAGHAQTPYRIQAWGVNRQPAVSISLNVPLKASVRAQLVKSLSEVAKSAGILTSAYNSRETPEVFLQPDFEANLLFDANRVRPYNAEKLGDDFTRGGVYWRRGEFRSGPVRIAVINTLPGKVDDFIEAMQRQLTRQFGFTIDMIRERKVKVVSPKNLESAVKVVEEEKPHLILAFVDDKHSPSSQPQRDGIPDNDVAGHLKSLTLARGTASQVIPQATMDDPEAMAYVIMGILGKTGSVPFVLVEPLDYADFIVGLDIVREKKKDGDRITGIARLYRSDGVFLGYRIRHLPLESEGVFYVLMRDLFPQREFAGKQVILHHDGPFTPAEHEVIMGWGKAIRARFCPVEIMKQDIPHLYALEGGKVIPPPWGSAFRLSEADAFLVSSTPQKDINPQPLHVRTLNPKRLTVEQAMHSVLVWTLLHYGAHRPPRLPVTIECSDEIARWLAKGILPEAPDGDVPFWL